MSNVVKIIVFSERASCETCKHCTNVQYFHESGLHLAEQRKTKSIIFKLAG